MTVVTGTTLSTAAALGTPQDDTGHDVDAAITAPEAAGNAALAAVRTGNREAAQQIIAEMLPDERADLADHLEELRKLLGPACAECGALTELGTCTTDPFRADCRFLCSRCWLCSRLPTARVHGSGRHPPAGRVDVHENGRAPGRGRQRRDGGCHLRP
ncbi:hypothetical protein [Streptomyces capitiformicae]|uniref:Uncharacterized protein n=1 Tax=Streptomyces capitiformicae TaxID=2014920 RepID=A0A919DD02_9ACTN|nr:hypothetical protein [Streptomyces capitiformicae]GHE34102.1 hypothetical protein GCM10017771_51500 [Streptomyces capitiformicae]